MESKLSQCQLGVFLDSVRYGGNVYHNANLFNLNPALDDDRLEEALRAVIAAHPLMSARIRLDDEGQPVMFMPETPIVPQLLTMSDAAFDEYRRSIIPEFQVVGGTLGVMSMIRTDSDLWLFFDFHHVIADGSSMIMMIREIDRAYGGEQLEPEPLTGFDIANREAERRLTPDYEAAREWYRQNYSGTDTEAQLYADSKGDRPAYHRQQFTLDIAPDRLRGGAPLCNAAMGIVLASFTHRDEAVFTTITHGRRGHETDRTFAMMVKTQPVRVHVEAGVTADGLLRDMKTQLVGNRRWGELFSFAEVSALTGISSDFLFAFQGRFLDIPQIGGSPAVRQQLGEVNAAAPVNMELFIDDDHVWIDASWRTDMYSDQAITNIAHAFGTVLDQLSGCSPDMAVADIAVTDSRQTAQLRLWGDAPAVPYDHSVPIESVIATQADSQPDRTAVVCGDRTLTRRQLQEKVNSVAAFLQSKGIGKGHTVGVMINRSELMAVYPLAIQTIGAAYMPLDPEFPQERLMFMIGDAGVKTILTADNLARRVLPDFGADNIIDISQIPDNSSAPAPVDKSGDDALVVLYTSGSTGKPKGVTLTRAGLLNFSHAYISITAMTESDRVPAYANFGFDAHMMDLYPTLMAGAEYHVLDDVTRHDLDALHDYFVARHITMAFMTTQICWQMATLYDLPDIRCLLGGGEKLPPLGEVPYSFFNLYGPTECSVIATYYETHGDLDGTIIGRPVPGYGIRVVDKQLRDVPAGVPGELVITGVCVGKGYLNRPELTAEKFLMIDGVPAYRTGDLARWTHDGLVHYLGRMDGMVKLRGLRIELGEIEAVATRHDAVRQFAAAVKTVGGNEQLVGYFSLKDGQSLTADQLRDFMSGKLTEFMIPTGMMQLDELPLTPNGKVDRRALPLPEISADAETLEAIEGPVERQVADIVAEIVGHNAFGATTNLMKVGLTSLLTMRLVAMISRKTGHKVAAKAVMLDPTVRAIARIIAQVEASGSAKPSGDAPKAKRRKFYPLSENQRGVYIDWMANPDALQYNVPRALKLNPGIDIDRLADALRQAVKTHPALSAKFVTHGDDIMQQRNDDAEAVVTVRGLDHEPTAAELQAMVIPFNLNTGPLYHIELLTHGSDCWLLMDFNHIVFDGMSAAVFADSVTRAYNGEELEVESYTAFDRAIDEHDMLMSEQADEAHDWFAKLLDGFQTTAYPHSQSADGLPGQMGRLSLTLDAAAVDAFCKDNAVTASNYFLSAFMQLLHRLTRQERIAITTVNNGREDERLLDDVGMFVKTLPVVSAITPAQAQTLTPAQAVANMQRQFITTQSYDFYPFTSIVRDFGIRPDIMYVYEGGIALDSDSGSPLSGKPVSLGLDTVKVPLTMLVFTPVPGQYELTVEYDASMYTATDMDRLLKVMRTLSTSLAAAATIADATTIDAEAERQLSSMRSGATGDVAYDSYHGAMEAWALETPDAMALVACDRSMTFDQFNRQANVTAHALKAHGVEHGDKVVVLLPRDSRLITTIYGVMKAGAAYIPCDPDYPAERIRLITEDSGARFIVTTADRMDTFPGKVIDVDTLLSGYDDSNPGIDISPDDLAYLIYTSGSTGRPKGVKIHHGAIANYLYAYRNEIYLPMGDDEPRVNMLLVTISFDASQVDLGTSLTSGHTLVLADDEQTKDVVKLAELMTRTHVQAFDATPSRLAAMLELPAFRNAIASCKLLNIGGEGFPASLLDKLADAGFRGIVVNEYGPTETTVGSNHAFLRPGDAINAGKPFYNYVEYIVDGWGGELPVGMTGELYIAGRGVGKGYHNLPDKTEASFVTFKDAVAYRTGDLARWTANGSVEILGRIDNQVKLRGLRIELGEIESVATAMAGVRMACADVRTIEGVEHLCLWYESDDVDPEALNTHLSRHLTEYMVPDSYTKLTKMPLTPNGKTDRRSLPEPQLEAPAEYVEPADGLERQIADAFAHVLGRDKVGAIDDFFKIGGTSINAIKVVARLAGTGVDVSYKDIFATRTARALGALLSGAGHDNAPAHNEKSAAKDASKAAEPLADVLAANTLESFLNGDRQPLDGCGVLLTGATGFMGIHMLHDLLTQYDCRVTCMVRGRGAVSGLSRLQTLCFYYFGETFADMLDKRLFVIEGDLTDAGALSGLDSAGIDVVINCAANVKHFSSGDDIERVNVGTVRNIVDWCVANGGKRLVHVSTVSVAGGRVDGVPDAATVLTEQSLEMGQNLSNQYVASKHEAERIILQAVRDNNLNAKIMRVGNLAPRASDGEFQINFRTNAFMGRLKAYLELGCVPFGHMDAQCEFSPIDNVCDAILRLAQAPQAMSVFMPTNNHHIPLGDVLSILSQVTRRTIRGVEQGEFQEALSQAMADEKRVAALQPLLAYSGRSGEANEYIGFNGEMTTQVLYRLGFRWNYTTWDYVERFIRLLDDLDFFADE